jgi:hypothetical protein
MPVSRAKRADSSRTSRAAAGWDNAGPAVGPHVERSRTKTFPRRFNWLQPRVLLESRNDRLASLVRQADTDIVNDERMRWVAARRAAGVDTEFMLERPDGVGESFSFLALGDPGEGDESQYVVVSHVLGHLDTQFAIVVSDVIYPTGETNDYADCFYRAYKDYPQPIFALPGNHDWYSLLTGFMWNFCGAESLPAPTDRLSSYSWQERLARFLWLRPRAPYRALLMAYREPRWQAGRANGAAPWQAGPYFALETPQLLILGIDTGTSGRLDREQAEWLLRMASRPGRKLLFTGKPIWVNGRHVPCEIDWLPAFSDDGRPDLTGDPRPVRTDDEPLPPPFPDVASIVRHRAFEFIAAIGGDVHNYQRYPVDVSAAERRVIQYVVAGGSGAFMSPTHTIDRMDRTEAPVGEGEFRCYPLRGDSLARFARGSARRIRIAVVVLAALALALLWSTVAVFNPRTGKFWTGRPGFIPAADYDRWVTVGIGGLLFALGFALVVLPWFHARVRIVLGLVAAGAGLLAWQGAFKFVPGGLALFVAAMVVGVVSIPVLTREPMRRTGDLVRAVAVVVLTSLALFLQSIAGDRWIVHFSVALLALAALAVLLVGGPRLKLRQSVYSGLAVAAVSFLLLVIVLGFSWLIVLGLFVLVSGFTLLAAYQLRWVLAFGTDVDADKAAEYMAELLSDEGRPMKAKRGKASIDRRTRGKLNALFAGHGKRSYLYVGGETAYSALFDSNDQPFFKSFLRIDVDGAEVKIYCFGVADETALATVEDHVRWNGSCWTDARAILGGVGGGDVVGEAEWYDDAGSSAPRLAFHLEDDQLGNRFVVLFSQGDEWVEAGRLTYSARYAVWNPEIAWEGRWPPRVALRRADDPGDSPTFAEGTFI